MTRVAIIGAGNMAREHARAFKALPGVELAGIHSRTRARAEALASEFGIATVSDGVAALRKESNADLVVVTVPEMALNGVAKQVFAEPWSVLLEKPAGIDLDDANDIAAAATASNSNVMVALNRRFYGSTMAAKADLDSRDERRFITVHDQQSYEEARFHNHPEYVVERFMYANSVHGIDYLMNLARGDVVDVTPIAPWEGESTEVCSMQVRFSSGDSGLYIGIWKGPGPWACTVSTPSRRWLLKPLEQAQYQNAGERQLHSVDPDPMDADYKPGFYRQAAAVVDKLHGKQSDAVTLAESLRTHELIHRMFGV